MNLSDVTFSYGEKQVMIHFSLTLPDTDVVALAGPSGCGKTTLLRLLAGLEKPESGTIEAPSPEQIAFLFQENRLLPGLNCADQLRAVLTRGAKVQQWLDAVGLGAEADTMPESLSGGMQRRLALARCMAYGADRDFLFLDEPFTGVDPPRAAMLMEALRALHVPVLMTAHDAESLSLANTIIRLDGPPLQQLSES